MKRWILIPIAAALLLLFGGILTSCEPKYSQEIKFYMQGEADEDGYHPWYLALETTLDEIINGDVRPPCPECPPGKKPYQYYASIHYYVSGILGPVSKQTTIVLFDGNLNPAPVENFLQAIQLEDNGGCLYLVVEYQDAPYSLIFDAREGSFGNGKTTHQTEMYAETSLRNQYAPLPKREGYIFDGWYNSADVKVSEASDWISKTFTQGTHFDLNQATLNFYAVWKPVDYTLTVDYGLPDVENVTHTVQYDAAIPDLSADLLDIGTREIVGWSLTMDGSKPLPETVKGNITVYPIWREYKLIDFQYPDGTVHNEKLSDAGNDVISFPILKCPGYLLENWIDADGNAIEGATFANLQSSYQGIWKETDYRVELIRTDGIAVSARSHTYGSITLLPILEKEGYSFLGWYRDDPESCVFFLSADLWEDVTLTARFAPRVFSVNLIAEGVTLTERFATMTYGENYTITPPPAREGYRFLGWFDAPSGGNQMTDAEGNSLDRWTSLDEGKTFYAVWKAV